MNSKTTLQKRVPTIIGRSTVFGENNSAIGRLSERENTRNASVYETAKYRADNGGPPYGRMVASWNCNLHVRTADVWALFSSSARFRGGDDSAAAPPWRKGRTASEDERAADERDGHEEWPAGSPESAARCNTCVTRAHARASILQLLTLMPFCPLGRTRQQVTQRRLARIVRCEGRATWRAMYSSPA